MKGLNRQEVEYRINNGLINNEIIKNSRSLKTIILSNCITLFNFIHIILFILVLTTGKIANGTFIIAILINTVISVYQEIKAKIIVDKLKITNEVKINVIREGKNIEILPSEIVIDDILYLKQGDSLVVDAQLIESNSIEVDESIVTGESEAVLKHIKDQLISGSIITSGTGYARVISINRNTYANNLINEASKVRDSSSYLMYCINKILSVITILIIPVGLSLFITQYFYSDQSYVESILSSVAGIIGMIPDGLVLLTSISLTVGVIKMASKKVIIQKLAGIELLACVDTLCLDKTGTITDGSMDVINVLQLDNKVNINDIIAAISSPNGNATDKALIKYFGNKSNLEVLSRIPFSSTRKYSLIETKNGIYAIGALECLSNKNMSEFKELDSYINEGYRILTLIKCFHKFDKKSNRILAFIILKDNIRINAKETLNYFREQNVEIKIISGDNPITVSNILKQLSIPDYDKYISGDNLPQEYEKLREIVDNYVIFGRVTPYQKQAIIKALKENKTVGYIGDGVNDILALKEADCGIALATGISAVRNVSEVVLTDSDFSILPGIVNEGRRVVNNIERVSSMYLIKTVYSFLLSMICIILSYEYPFYPIQLTLISAVCVGIPSFFLAIEPNYMKVQKGFLLKVFRNALPSGICIWINITFLIMISDIFDLNFDVFRLTIVAVTGYLNLRLLYNVSKPLTLMRKILVYTCFITFYTLLMTFREFFLIYEFSFLSIIFIILFIFANIYLVEFLEDLYDYIVKIFKDKRSRISSEKK